MTYINPSCSNFVSYIKKIYSELGEAQKQSIQYKDLIAQAAKHFYDGYVNESQINYGYQLCRKYYESHPLNINKRYLKVDVKKLTMKEFKIVLDFDLRKESLSKALDYEYRYYWFDQTVTDNNGLSHNKRILIIEYPIENKKDVYKVLKRDFSEFYDSFYYGFGGIALVFDDANKFQSFNEFLKFLKK